MTSRRPPGLWDDVEIDRELRRASQLIRQCEGPTGRDRGGAESLGHPYLPAPMAGWSDGLENAVAAASAVPSRRQSEVVSRGAANHLDQGTLVPLIAGAVLLIVGLIFLAIAVVDERPDWWQPGLPLAILGQASLSLGIVFKLELLQRRSPPSR